MASEKVRQCSRCREMKGRYDFSLDGQGFHGISKICKECKARDYEVADCNEGDKVIYISPLKHTHNQVMTFKSMAGKKYCVVEFNGGESKIYLPYLRKYVETIND